VTRFIAKIVMTLVTPKAAPKLDILFNILALEVGFLLK
jgi:hypothetical protein